MEANRSYWRRGFPKVDELVFEFGVQPHEILNGFRDGRFNVASDLFPADIEALRRDPEFAAGYRESPRLSTYFAAFNIQREPFNDKILRQSLTSSIEVASLVRRTLGRMALPAHGLIPPGLLGHNPKQTARDRYSTSAPVRVKPGSPIEIKTALNAVYLGEYSAVFNELTNAFAEHNLRVTAANRTMPEFAELRQQGSADLLLTRWIGDFPDTDNFVRLLHSQVGAIGRYCGTAEIDRLIERGVGETSPAVRHTIYREIEEIIAREALLLPGLRSKVSLSLFGSQASTTPTWELMSRLMFGLQEKSAIESNKCRYPQTRRSHITPSSLRSGTAALAKSLV
jgi:peptide/nickel transport system substrate-binding protein